MEIANKVRRCKQDQCPVSESGKCLEGLDPENCSYAYWENIESDNTNSEVVQQTVGQSFIKLFLINSHKHTQNNTFSYFLPPLWKI